MSDAGLLTIRGLRISSRLGDRERTIVGGVALDVAAGETLGVVGESGSGKSMMARTVAGLLPSGVLAEGEIRYQGRELLTLSGRERPRLRGTEIAMIFQDPFTMLNPLMRCGRQITELLLDERGHRLGRRGERAEAQRRLEEVGIEDQAVADAYPFELSGAMRQRVGIAAALARDPRLLIADEPSTALDATTQQQILGHLKDLQRTRGMGMILITHDLRVAMSDRIAVLYAGSLLEWAETAAIEARPLHPYTLGLLLSEPPVDRRLAELTAIDGTVPRPDDVAGQCVFAPRCRWQRPAWKVATPPLAEVAPARFSACLRQAEIRADMASLRVVAAVAGAPNGRGRSGADVLVAVRGLTKVFEGAAGRHVHALSAVDVELSAGESVGIDASDYSALSATDRRRLRSTIQMVFQDPYATLNPVRSVAATLAEALAMHSPRTPDVSRRVRSLLERVGVPVSYAERKPVALSGGERQRVAIARALAAGPRVIVCDEAVSALDVSVQAQILNLLASVRRETGVGYLFISHDLAVVRQVVDRLYVMWRGEVVEAGPTDELLDHPRHPYTRSLMESVPRADTAWLADPQGGVA